MTGISTLSCLVFHENQVDEISRRFWFFHFIHRRIAAAFFLRQTEVSGARRASREPSQDIQGYLDGTDPMDVVLS